MAAGEMEGDRIETLPDPAADLDETEAESAELEMRRLTPGQPAADGIQQPVGSTVQQQPKLIGPEPVAAQSIGEATLLEVLDAEFGVIPPLGVPGGEGLWVIVAGGDHEADVEARLQDLGFDDHPAVLPPGSGWLSALGKQADLLPDLLSLCPCIGTEWRREVLQPRIGG